MFEKIVIPADLTHRNREAVAMAERLVDPATGTICLVHVIETIPGFDMEEEKTFYERLEKTASDHLRRLAESLEQSGIRWRAQIVYGPRVRSILDEASKMEAELIVIQSHRVSKRPSAEGWGTLSYQVSIFAECPVLLVK